MAKSYTQYRANTKTAAGRVINARRSGGRKVAMVGNTPKAPARGGKGGGGGGKRG